MARFQTARIRSFIAEVDLSAKKYFIVKLGTNDEEVDLAGAGEGFGVLMNSPRIGETAEVAMIGGGAQVVSGAAFAKGIELVSDAAGKAVAVSGTGQNVVALSLKAAGGADEWVEVDRIHNINEV